MTVTLKKRKFDADEDSKADTGAAVVETSIPFHLKCPCLELYKSSWFFIVNKNTADYGQKYHCDHCSKDLSQQMRIKCAECPDYDLCLDCFSIGSETKDHKKEHSYRLDFLTWSIEQWELILCDCLRVIEVLDFPIFSQDWGADEGTLKKPLVCQQKKIIQINI